MKALATAAPTLAAGIIGLVSTGSAAVAAVVATAVSAVASPAVDSWFKGREIKAEEEAAAAAISAEFNSAGAMGEALVTIGTLYQLIEEIVGRAEVCQRSLEQGRTALANVLGGGNAVPRNARETYGLNEAAQADLKRVCSGVGEAAAALRRLQAAIS